MASSMSAELVLQIFLLRREGGREEGREGDGGGRLIEEMKKRKWEAITSNHFRSTELLGLLLSLHELHQHMYMHTSSHVHVHTHTHTHTHTHNVRILVHTCTYEYNNSISEKQ